MIQDFIVIDIGKVFIVWEENHRTFYQNVEGKMVKLTGEKLLQVELIFKCDNGYKYDSVYLNQIIDGNPKIEVMQKAYYKQLLTYLENIIPEGGKNSFYKNVQSLEVEIIDDSSNVFESSLPTVADYNTQTNKVKIFQSGLNKILEVAKTTDDPSSFYSNHVGLNILHELAHMASSIYNNITKVSLCGFNKYPSLLKSHENRGLTEGMTEVIAMSGFPGTVELASGYYIEASIVNMLIQIVGCDELLNGYFVTHSTEGVENKLNQLVGNSEMATDLFRKIEDNYYIKSKDIPQTFLGNIQETLIRYFGVKIKKAIEEGTMSTSEIENSINIFGQMLLTKEKLQLLRLKPKNYINLEESLELWEQLRGELILKGIPKK